MLSTLYADEPRTTVISNQFHLPLPRITKRDVVAMKEWVPQYVTTDGSCGEAFWEEGLIYRVVCKEKVL